MRFQESYIYHIFNQGNNRRKIFFSRENYLYFTGKIRKYILPYGDILSWCLMPNHFHLMVLINHIQQSVNTGYFSRSGSVNKTRTINDSIGLMLRSYTNAINKQEKSSGSLFRKQTKAECVNCPKGLDPAYYTINGVTQGNIGTMDHQYPQILFEYIQENPVKAGFVMDPAEWEFSSAAAYAGKRESILINRKMAKEYGLVYNWQG